MRLIITEKNDAAKKIAAILSSNGVKEESYLRVPYYLFTDADGQPVASVGLKGHVLQVDFPPEFSEWRKVEPKALIDAPLIKTETAKSVVRTVKKLAADATTLIIATDYDREGELIGLEALNLALEENAKLVRTVRRARFSALTPGEITRAFSHLDHLSEPLAWAGEARQDIDLIWGATLTRFVSLATSRLGSQFLSVGRVQTPTLVLVVEREKERRAFVAEPYWVVKVELDTRGRALQRRPQGGALQRRGPGHGDLREARRSRPGDRSQADQPQGPAAGAFQHHQLHQRRHRSGLQGGDRDARRRGPLHGGPHQLPAYRQHRLSVVARSTRCPGHPGPGRVRPRGRDSCSPGRRFTPAGATNAPPTTRPSTRREGPGAESWATESGAYTSWWLGASWPPCPTKR